MITEIQEYRRDFDSAALCSCVQFTAVSPGTGAHCSGLRKPSMKDFNDVQVSCSMQQCQLASTRWHSRAAEGGRGEGCGRVMGRSGS